MGSAFHQLCPRYSGTLTPTAPMANRLWETFTYMYLPTKIGLVASTQKFCCHSEEDIFVLNPGYMPVTDTTFSSLKTVFLIADDIAK